MLFRSVKEEFLGEINDEQVNPDANEPEIDVMKGKNTVKINPELPGSDKTNMRSSMQFAHYEAEGEVIAETDGYSKFLGMLQEKKMTKAAKKKEKKLKKKYDPSGMKASMKNQYGEKKGEEVYFATIRKQAMKEESDCGCDEKPKMDSGKKCDDDPRSMPTKINMVKNKLRSMGLRMSYEPEGELVDEAHGDYDPGFHNDSRRGRGEMGEPKATTPTGVDPKKHAEAMKFWRKKAREAARNIRNERNP